MLCGGQGESFVVPPSGRCFCVGGWREGESYLVPFGLMLCVCKDTESIILFTLGKCYCVCWLGKGSLI